MKTVHYLIGLPLLGLLLQSCGNQETVQAGQSQEREAQSKLDCSGIVATADRNEPLFLVGLRNVAAFRDVKRQDAPALFKTCVKNFPVE